MQIAQLQPVPLRDLWPHEAHQFTVWLADNVELLADKIGMELTVIEREVSAGAFSADILAEDAGGNSVIIENQLERTDHDHLGKLITYMSNLGAKTAVWITSDPRPEHEQAVHWLNEMLPADTAFYLVKVEAFQINDSLPAPHFSVVAGPTPEARQAGTQKKAMAQRHVLRLEFWQQLLARSKAHTQLHARISPSKENWVSAGAGKSGLSFNYVILMHEARVELYIDSPDVDKNKQIFDELARQREEIDSTYGTTLEWARRDDRRASAIIQRLKGGGLTDADRWPTIQSSMIDSMARLEKTLKPHIRRLKS